MTNLVQPDVPAAMRGATWPAIGADRDRTVPGRLLLFLLVFAAWYPLDPWWQSDDLIAVHYAADLGRALSDFSGNQYGLEGVVWFYRPLITLSFWLEQAVAGGPSPLLSHLSNTVAHALSAVLVGAIAARFLGPLRGWLTGLVWGLAPAHTAAIFWAAGRVDSHTMVWIALACVLHLRFLEGRTRRRWPSWLALVLALCSKEQALVVPGAMVLLGFCHAAPTERVRTALRAWPAFVLAAAYLGGRFLLFGRLGGYDAAAVDPLAAVRGLGDWALTLSNPLRRMGGSVLDVPDAVLWLGYLPVAVALCWALWRRQLGLVTASAIAFVGLAAPAVQSWAQTGSIEGLRYFYVPFVACSFLLAAGGILPVLLMLAVFALPTVEQHRDWFGAYHELRTGHRLLIDSRAEVPGDVWFVSGLPRQNERRTVVEFHLGVDRLLQPPFVDADPRTVLALRPLDPRADVITCPYGDDRGLPFARPTLRLEGSILRTLPRAVVPDLTVSLDGVDAIATRDLIALNDGRTSARILARGVRADAFRVTLFTAAGYVSAVVADRGADGSADGAVDLRELLRARYVSAAGADRAHVLFALAVATTFDLEPTFPVLVEALRDGATTHANREPLQLRFDRQLAEFVRGPR